MFIICYSSAQNLFLQTRNPLFQVSHFSGGRPFMSLCQFGILKCGKVGLAAVADLSIFGHGNWCLWADT